MNKQEINDMMKDLPSQQLPDETLIQKMKVAIMLIVIFLLMVWVPDFTLTEEECKHQTPHAITSGLCSEPKAK
jgi:hypothetical protein